MLHIRGLEAFISKNMILKPHIYYMVGYSRLKEECGMLYYAEDGIICPAIRQRYNLCHDILTAKYRALFVYLKNKFPNEFVVMV